MTRPNGTDPSGMTVLRSWLPAIVLAGSVAVFAGWTRSLFPTPGGTLGHDWSYFLPTLLAGNYWIAENGLLVPPVFSPAFCGGVPFLANPQSLFYSLPQALFLIVSPVNAAHLLLVLSAVVGAAGAYRLARSPFGISREAATLAAVLFLFNGFLTFRLVIGQPHFHTFALVPWLAWALLREPGGAPDDAVGRSARHVATGGGVGLALAYFVYAGSPNILVPVGFAVVMVWLLHAVVRGPRHSFWAVGLGATLLGAAISAWKAAPARVFLDAVSREHGINLFDSPLAGADWLVRGLFFAHTIQDGDWFGREGIGFPRSEAEFGLTPVPLLLVGWALWKVIRGRGGAKPPARRLVLYGLPLAALLALPYLMSVHLAGWGWHDLLNRIPYVQDQAQLMRWWFVYIPPAVAAAAVAFDRVLEAPRGRLVGLGVAVGLVVAFNLATDLTYYHEEPYDPVLVVEGWHDLRAGGAPPPVVEVGWPADAAPRGERAFSLDLNDRMTEGVSPFPCYEPVFGYFLRFFPNRAALEHAPPWRLSESRFNFRNPACYIYGDANRCAPGDHFTEDERASLDALTRYRPFPYRIPGWQRLASGLSLTGLALALLALAVPPMVSLLRRRAPGGGPSSSRNTP